MNKSLSVILLAGAVAAVLDISDAFLFLGLRGIRPARILQGIASGLLGPQSFRYGSRTVLLGLALHFFIAFSVAAVYYAASRKIAFLTTRPVLSGLLYGAIVYAFMNGIVLPLSAFVSRGPMTAAAFINGVLAIMLLVGLPIALIVSRLAAL